MNITEVPLFFRLPSRRHLPRSQFCENFYAATLSILSGNIYPKTQFEFSGDSISFLRSRSEVQGS